MKKILLITLLIITITFLLSACGDRNQTPDEPDEPNAPVVTIPPNGGDDVVFTPGVRYLVEQLSLLPYDAFASHNIGTVFLHDDLVYIPRIIERFKFSDEFIEEYIEEYDIEYWNYGNGIEIQTNEAGHVRNLIGIAGPLGERFVIGQDLIYGEDFFSLPYFVLEEVDFESEEDERVVAFYFDNDVERVSILDVDLKAQHRTGEILLLANQFHENGEFSTIFARLIQRRLDHDFTVIEQNLLGSNSFVRNAMFDRSGNILLVTVDLHTQKHELIVLDPTASRRLAQLDIDASFQLARGRDGGIWCVETVVAFGGMATTMRFLNTQTWTWTDETMLPMDSVNGFYPAPTGSEFTWFISTDYGLYGITAEHDIIQILLWHDVDLNVMDSTELLFPTDGLIIVADKVIHPRNESAFTLDSVLLRRTDIVDERDILSIGGVNIRHPVLHDLVRRFNRESETHRAVIVDYADTGEWVGVTARLRTDLIRGEGPDVVILNQWGDENDITTALMRGGFLADLNVFLENDPVLSREAFFENILDIWTNEAGVLSLITGAVVPTPYWGPSEKLVDFTDFTHEGFLAFLRNAKAQGVDYPMGLNFLPEVILQTMLFADDTFVCYKTGEANFESDLFLDILNYAAGITDEQQLRWTEAFQTSEIFRDPLGLIFSGEQLMIQQFGFMDINDFRVFDAAVGGMTVFGAPNAAGELSIATGPVTRMGISANSQNADAAWEFIRLAVLYPNSSGIQGFPVLRSLFEADINMVVGAGPRPADGFMGFTDFEIPAFTVEHAALLRNILESITHESFPDPHILAIVLEDTTPFFAGTRTAEDAARIIQSRVSIYLAEMN